MADTTNTIVATLKEFLRDYEDETLRSRMLTALLMKRGRIINNCSGRGPQWQVKWKRAVIQGNDGSGTVTFSEVQRYKQPSLPVRGYAIPDSISKRAMVINRGPEALINLAENITKNLTTDLDEQFSEEFYVDGNASGNEDRIHGVESFFGTNGTVTITTGAQRSANAADWVGYPDDSYADLDTDLGAYGGSQSSQVWPLGVATPDYDFYTPVIVNYTSTAFSGSADTWAQQCVEAMRFGITHSHRNKSAKGALDLIVLDRDLYRQFKEKQDSKERVNIEVNDELREFGFKTMAQLDGVTITSEYGLPSTVGYGFNVDMMELRNYQDQLFVPEEDYDIASRRKRYVVDFIGNLKCESPRHFLKLMTLA